MHRKHAAVIAICMAGALFGFFACYFDPVGGNFLRPADFPMIEPTDEKDEQHAHVQTTGELQAFSAFGVAGCYASSLCAWPLYLASSYFASSPGRTSSFRYGGPFTCPQLSLWVRTRFWSVTEQL